MTTKLYVLIIFFFPSIAFAKDVDLVMTPTRALPMDLALVNGDSIMSSRYAGIIVPEPGMVKIVFDGVTETMLNAKFSLDTVQFQDETSFKSFLKDVGIHKKYIEKIITQNNNGGFVHSENCKGSRSECVVASKGVDFVVDYYNQAIRLFVTPEILEIPTGEKKYLNLNGEVGIINNVSAYYHESFGYYNPTYYIRDQGVVGAGVGFLRYNIYRSDLINTVDELYYNHALKFGNKILAGRTQSNGKFNPSSSQSVFSDIYLTGIRFGTADELIDNSYGKKIFNYYSPSNGTLEVYKDNKLVYAISTKAGFGELNLANLPFGQYNAIIRVKSSSGSIISSQNILVNNGSFNSGFSWHFFGGKSSNYSNEFIGEDTQVIETGIQLPLTPLSALYVGGARVEENNIFSTGMIFKKDPVSLTTKMGLGTNNFHYYEVNSYVDQLSLSYKKVSAGRKWGDKDSGSNNTTLSAGYNLNFMTGLSANIGYIYSSSMMPYYEYDDSYRPGIAPEYRYKKSYSSNRSLYANMFYSLTKNSSVYLSANKELGGDNYNVSLGFNFSFDGGYNFNNVSTYNQGKKITNNSTVDYSSKISEQWFHAVSAGSSISNTSYNSAAYNISHNSNIIRGSGSYYATDNGQKQLTITADSSQAITGNGGYFIPSSWNNDGIIIRGNNAKYNISVKNKTNNNTTYLDSDKNIINVPAYSNIIINSDTTGSDLVFENHQDRDSSHFALVPGSVVIVSGNTVKTNSVIVTLKNSNNEYSSTASCLDESCILVSKLNKGVFRVKYVGDSFILRSGPDLCMVNDINSSNYISVTCQKR